MAKDIEEVTELKIMPLNYIDVFTRMQIEKLIEKV